MSRRLALTLAATLTASLGASLGAAAPAGAQNLALNRPVFASSEDPNYTLPESVDGDRLFTIGGARGFSTRVNDNPWWYVDLGAEYDIARVEFYGRTDGPRVRLSDAVLGLFDAAPYLVGSPAPVESWTFPNWPATNPYPSTLVFTSTSSARGRFVGIRIPRNQEVLNFGEVEVYAAAPTQVVPEPSTYALLAAGLAGVAAGVRRRRAAA